MRKLLTISVLGSLLATASLAATFTFSGTVNGASGIFGEIPQGTPVSGSLEITGVGPDQAPGDPNFGQFAVTFGLFTYNVGDFAEGTIDIPNDFGGEILVEKTLTELTENLRVSTVNIFETVELNLTGSSGFLGTDEFPGVINWSLFTGGTGLVTQNLIAVAGEPLEPEGDAITFTIDNVSDVPEPGTLAVAGLGLAVVAWRRRQSR